MIGLMTNPPKPGDPSFSLYEHERDNICASLQRRAKKLSTALNSLEGVSCTQPEGALYVFPKITLSSRAIAAASAIGKAPDAYYCMKLLDKTGIVVVPGSGFRQEPGTYHFRSTILPSESDIDRVITDLKIFHEEFIREHKD